MQLFYEPTRGLGVKYNFENNEKQFREFEGVEWEINGVANGCRWFFFHHFLYHLMRLLLTWISRRVQKSDQMEFHRVVGLLLASSSSSQNLCKKRNNKQTSSLSNRVDGCGLYSNLKFNSAKCKHRRHAVSITHSMVLNDNFQFGKMRMWHSTNTF